MKKEFIIAVLDYFSGEVDMFRAKLEDTADLDVMIQEIVEDRGHHISDCHYMYSLADTCHLKIML